MKSEPQYLILNTRDELLRIDVGTIVYFEAEGNYTHIVLENGTRSTVCMNLGVMQRVLDERLQARAAVFARVGKRHIVNLNCVYLISLSRQRLFLSNGRTYSYQLDISKEALKALRELYVQSFQSLTPNPSPKEREISGVDNKNQIHT